MKIVALNFLAGLGPVQLNEGAQLHLYGSNKALGYITSQVPLLPTGPMPLYVSLKIVPQKSSAVLSPDFSYSRPKLFFFLIEV